MGCFFLRIGFCLDSIRWCCRRLWQMRQRGRRVWRGRWLHWGGELWVVFKYQLLFGRPSIVMKTLLNSLKPAETLEEAEDYEEGDKETGGEEQLAHSYFRLHTVVRLVQIFYKFSWMGPTWSVDQKLGAGEQIAHAHSRLNPWEPSFHCPSSDHRFSKTIVWAMFLHFSYAGSVTTHFQLSKCLFGIVKDSS